MSAARKPSNCRSAARKSRAHAQKQAFFLRLCDWIKPAAAQISDADQPLSQRTVSYTHLTLPTKA